ncbi:MAG: CHAT domain-containing protein [Cyanobacteria bacterium P01_A01_bin.114]
MLIFSILRQWGSQWLNQWRNQWRSQWRSQQHSWLICRRFILRRFILRRFVCCFLLSLGLCLGVSLTQASWAQTPPLLQQGVERYHRGDLLGAVEVWQQSLVADPPSAEQPIDVWKYLARAQRQLGQVSEAMASLDELVDYYRQVEDWRQLGQILTEQAQLYGDLGQPQNAIALLCGKTAPLSCDGDGALALARQQQDRLGEAAALGVLGQTYSLQGEYEAALETLERSLEISNALHQPAYSLAAANTLGNVYTSLSQRNTRYAQFARQAKDLDDATRFEQTAQDYNQMAIDQFTQSLELAQTQGDTVNGLRAQLNLILPIYRQTGQASGPVATLLNEAQQQLNALPDTREKAYSAIRLANLVGQVRRSPVTAGEGAPAEVPPPGSLASNFTSPGFTQCVPLEAATGALLQQAVAVSRQIQDPVAEAFAIGWLGHLYECAEDYDGALQLTEQAQLIATQPESRYLWEWQAGRILKAQGKPVEATAVYQRAVDTLEGIQGDIAIANRDLRLDFRDAVEVIYRQLTELQLDRAAQTGQQAGPQTLLAALSTLDGLRLAELRNYLGSECDLSLLANVPQQLETTTAALSSLIFDDRLVVILALPTATGQPQAIVHEVSISKPELVAQVNDFRYRLEQRSDRTNSFLMRSQQLYDWLIRPFEAELTTHRIETLVFNHDGILRSVPMAALHDGEVFLLQTYAISNSPSFAAATAPALPPQSLQVLSFWLTTPARVAPTERFTALAAVGAEIRQIEAVIPGSVGVLDEAFTQQRLREGLAERPVTVLHLATHAQFGYDSNETFLVTGEKVTTAADSYNRPLTINELYRLIRQLEPERPPLQLLTLTACETAAGSERDALGIAGVAVQAGVESAVASLWQVEDLATAELITRFYENLQAGMSRSTALQTTQKEWLATHEGGYQHPGYWAALVLIGSG